ncbi:MAG: hypothetical protein DRQ59_11680, partial [Gammaproteobacteria bacterium]
MGNSDNEASTVYLKTLLSYYEDEISGESYLYALAEHFDEKNKINLLARIERRAAESIQPLLEKYGLEPRDESVLNREGRSYLESHDSYSW